MVIPFKTQDICYSLIQKLADQYGGKITSKQIQEVRDHVKQLFQEAKKQKEDLK